MIFVHILTCYHLFGRSYDRLDFFCVQAALRLLGMYFSIIACIIMGLARGYFFERINDERRERERNSK